MTVRIEDLSYGAIVYATVSDERGGNFTRRRLVVITPNSAITKSSPMVLVCITTQFRTDETFVPLPHALRGHPATTLDRPSAAACRWLRVLDLFDIDEVVGFAPLSCLEAIVRQVRKLNANTLGKGQPIVANAVTPINQTPRG